MLDKQHNSYLVELGPITLAIPHNFYTVSTLQLILRSRRGTELQRSWLKYGPKSRGLGSEVHFLFCHAMVLPPPELAEDRNTYYRV